MKRKIIAGLAIVTVLSSYWIGFSLGTEQEDIYEKLDIFAESIAVIERKYVEDKQMEELIYGALDGMLLSLDPYSQFLTPDDYKELLVETEGKFGGLGIEITIRDGLLTIVSPMEGTPAWDAGLKAGDVIVKIEEEVTKGITLLDAVKKLRGEPGTEVTITVLREKTRNVEDVTITRGIIKIQDIKGGQILEDGIGYLRIAEFRETTHRDLDKVLSRLDQKELRGLIVDVRNNPGGLLDSAVRVSSRFLEAGARIVSTKARGEKERTYDAVSGGSKILGVPMVVLINKGSASGSEILAAALRDHNRAVLLGETTFGKGSVQTIVPLSDGSALRLTTAKYYTPAGISIHDKGIEPDITVEEKEMESAEDVFKKLQEQKNDFDYKKDYQIIRALDLIRGMLVLSQR
ncbi:MAG: PDZ domain-containing protein [Candidatus Omnitrophica bacterium]|nr:PDZ domain-containing protein [Candidatus Omnitrophota bacterium]